MQSFKAKVNNILLFSVYWISHEKISSRFSGFHWFLLIFLCVIITNDYSVSLMTEKYLFLFSLLYPTTCITVLKSLRQKIHLSFLFYHIYIYLYTILHKISIHYHPRRQWHHSKQFKRASVTYYSTIHSSTF